MPSLKSIMKPSETIEVSFGSELVNVTFRPQYLTPEFEDNLKNLGSEGKATDAFLELFCSVVESWDVKVDESDPEPIPISKESLRSVPYDILGTIIEKVQEKVSPNSKTEPNLGDTSLPEDGSAPSLTGTDF